jgi:general secretion pathway protein L
MNLNSTIDFDIKYFFRWWFRELAFLVPEKLRKALSEKTGFLYISLQDDRVHFYQLNGSEKKTLESFDGLDDLATKFQNLIAKHPEMAKTHLVCRLQTGQALSRMLFLPAAAKENLRQVVAFEMDKYMPFSADQVYFDVKPIGRVENSQMKVLMVLTPKDKLDTLYGQLVDSKIYPEVIDFEDEFNDLGNDPAPYNLLPDWEKPVQSKFTQFIHLVLGVTLVGLIIAVLGYPLWQSEQTVEDMRRQLSELEKESHLVQTRQLEVDEIVAETERLIKLKRKSPSPLQLLDTLSKLVPDDTWLTHLQYREQQLQVQGQSPAASALISLLEASPRFSNARFVSPLTQDRLTGLERFQLSVDVNVLEDNNE